MKRTKAVLLAGALAWAGALASAGCGPALAPRPAARLDLGPHQRLAPLPATGRGALLAAVQVATAGSLRVEGAAGSLWLGKTPRSSRAQGHLFGPTPVAVDSGTWYLFCDAPATGGRLRYLPPWHPIETALLPHSSTDPAAGPAVEDLAALRRALAPHRARQPRATHELALELMRRHSAAQIDAALTRPRAEAEELLHMAAARLDSLPPDVAEPLRARLEETRGLNAPRYLRQALYTAGTDELLAHCPPHTQDADPQRPDESLCQMLELIRADELLEAADEAQQASPDRAADLREKARALLDRRPGEGPGPLAAENAHQALARAQRHDLLGRAVALSKPGLYARLRRQSEAVPQIEAAGALSQRLARLQRRATQEASQESYAAALSLGREALEVGRQAAAAWQKLDDAYAATKPLEAIRRDTTRLRQETALWESYIDYRLDLETWDAALQRAARTTDPALAPRRYAELDELGTRLERSTPPAAVSSAAVENLRQRIRAEKTRLGLLALEGTASPAALHRMPIDELLAHYHLAGKLFTGHAALPAAVADSLRQRRTALLRAIGDRAGTDIDRELQAHRWQRAEAHASRVSEVAPQAARPLHLRVALHRARYLRDQAQADLERAFVADALTRYEEARQVLAPYGNEPAAREIRDFVELEIANLRSQNLALSRLETEPLPLGQCLGAGQPLPQSMPFTLIVRRGLVALNRAGADDYVRAYDIELLLPKEDFDRLSIKPVTADKEREIPTEYTDLLDGRVSLVLRTAGLEEAAQVQITFSGGRLDLQSIGRRWFIHKGLHL